MLMGWEEGPETVSPNFLVAPHLAAVVSNSPRVLSPPWREEKG